MRSREIARRYADALYQLAAEAGTVAVVEGDLRGVVNEVAETPGMGAFLTHPLVTRERKTALLEGAFAHAAPHVRHLLGLVVRNGREAYLDLILDEYISVRTDAERTARVRVATAQELTDVEKDELRRRLESALGRPVIMDERFDEALLAGARIEVDGKVIDGTLRAKLDGLRSSLER